MYEELDEDTLEWLKWVQTNGTLLEVFDKRESYNNETIHRISNRIETYYTKGEVFEDVELTVWIKIENDEIVGYQTY